MRFTNHGQLTGDFGLQYVDFKSKMDFLKKKMIFIG